MNTQAKMSVNMKQMKKWEVCQDNVQFYDTIMRNNGVFFTLDSRPYVENLCAFNIFFTESK